MAPVLCAKCKTERALVKRPKNHQKLCKACFISVFEEEVHHTIVSSSLFSRGEQVAIGASGGKDSTVLASVLKTLNDRYDYGLNLVLLSIDEGIKGYRDDSLETVKRNAVQYDMPLTIVGYDELYGWTMDQVVEVIGKKGNCTYCGVFRRQALDRGARILNIKHVVTGHNADDVAETILMNLLRGDLPRLGRSTSIVTGDDTSDVKRSKPLKYSYEKEIVLYAHHKKLDYFSTECIYSPEAFRGTARTLIKNLERVRPSAILDIVRSGEDMARLVAGGSGSSCACKGSAPRVAEDDFIAGCGSQQSKGLATEIAQLDASLSQTTLTKSQETDFTTAPSPSLKIGKKIQNSPETPRPRHGQAQATTSAPLQTLGKCEKCGYMSSQAICQACLLVDGLNKNKAQISL
ncbi:PP-loop family protein [Colletotrichum scovillei]|uniref:Cytoplasmic tRNA 2-thiolation protein 1 n=1 Tax=Colletotrichum scovillei TaxID=1209932 RepID=A0A9P7UBW6_9PEZI|nr:PP-loop family protein [Colletotrichum scovillei]KAF4780891.1 PP-loop family protein [Colletotrichum scovillei]KAG7045519.1 Cytoplasmic tRNA 2-thiolation protein 1 [Colletotrichum scovillei]KAG7052682.1 Cytoplasmic tRNA 2-thiolation protein 1 [Colletotrichum scovillei]KAG7064972.1 Cytoplasmic tRNA 2-thiolation protein 1 [Colletotrichum scovillei]